MLRSSPLAFASIALIASLSCLASCSATFHAKSCKTDGDCGPSLVCGQRSGQAACVAGNEDPIRIGMSAPLTGPSQELGTEMKKGITLAFDAQNAAGGIRGRTIELEFRDDQYQPQSAESAARDLLDVSAATAAPARCPTTTASVVAGDAPVGTGALTRGPNAVLALVGSVGTPTMVRSAPIAVETGSLFFGAFTGAAKVLRDEMSGACHKYIFNVRASYAQEARATVEYFKKLRVPDARHFLSFDQNDSFGQAGYDGLVAALTAMDGAPDTPVARFRYTRDDQTSVPAQVQGTTAYLAKLLAEPGNHVVGILMTDTYGPATQYIKGIRDWQYAQDAEQTATLKAKRLTLLFSNVSFVGPNSLAARLKDAGSAQSAEGPKPYTAGVFVSQVVPNYESDDSDGVRDYLRALQAADLKPSFTSLEGYLAGRVFVAGLAAHQGAFTPDALVSTFENLPHLNLGLGATSGFTAARHDYSKSVFGTAIDADGGFSNSYFWSEGSAIQLFE
jgi:ABC-type branched-subunit amino acid transport system substrate-binding protein